MARSKPKTHDDYIRQLRKLVEKDYLGFICNFTYSSSFGTIGEVDLIGVHTNIFDLYEVKSNTKANSMRKAVTQLKTARQYLGQQGREYVFTPKNGIQPIEKIIQDLFRKK
jgi:hypothetical protein